MNWVNGRKLSDEWENIRNNYFEPDFISDLSPEEQAEVQWVRARLIKNQSR